MKEARDRIEHNSIPEPNSGCWIWMGALDKAGYARISVRNRNTKASRYAHEVFSGKELGDMCALHRCDNPACVNPDHIYAGTMKQNAHDRMIRGRKGDIAGAKHPECGTKNHASKLNEMQVREIRGLIGTVGYKRLAKRFGVAPSSIQGIANGKRWGWLV